MTLNLCKEHKQEHKQSEYDACNCDYCKLTKERDELRAECGKAALLVSSLQLECVDLRAEKLLWVAQNEANAAENEKLRESNQKFFEENERLVGEVERLKSKNASIKLTLRNNHARAMQNHRDMKLLLTAAQQSAKEQFGAGWQPIETAPAEGKFLAYRDGEIVTAEWMEDAFGEKVLGGKGWHFANWAMPSHWMPLPEIPTAIREAAKEGR